jgi:hypothetical protein
VSNHREAKLLETRDDIAPVEADTNDFDGQYREDDVIARIEQNAGEKGSNLVIA